MRKTKIICTLGPATDKDNIIKDLILNGMNTARINMSHDTHEIQKVRCDQVKKAREELNTPVALLMDTKGPEIRIGKLASPIDLKAGDKLVITVNDADGTDNIVPVSFADLPKDVGIGDRILVDDGLVTLEVTEKNDVNIICTALNNGTIKSRKSINIPGASISLPFISDDDEKDLLFGIEQDVDFIAASFTRCADDILSLRSVLERHNAGNIKIIAKIENAEGVQNIDDIIKVSDGIMVARGDLGVEIPFEEIPVIQKNIIRKVYRAGKHVITATQMLDSMESHPRPTRAETTDVANAVYDGTSAIMLSGETAAGKYPVLAVQTMALIAERAENDINYYESFKCDNFDKKRNVTYAISHATCTTARDLGAVAIIAVTKFGNTGRMVSRFRPQCPIICCTTDEKSYRQMSLTWGAIPVMVDNKNNTDDLFAHVVEKSANKGLLHSGDTVVITAGLPLGVPGSTNLLKVQTVE